MTLNNVKYTLNKYAEKCEGQNVGPLMAPHWLNYKKLKDFGKNLEITQFTAFGKVLGNFLNNFMSQMTITTYRTIYW